MKRLHYKSFTIVKNLFHEIHDDSFQKAEGLRNTRVMNLSEENSKLREATEK